MVVFFIAIEVVTLVEVVVDTLVVKMITLVLGTETPSFVLSVFTSADWFRKADDDTEKFNDVKLFDD